MANYLIPVGKFLGILILFSIISALTAEILFLFASPETKDRFASSLFTFLFFAYIVVSAIKWLLKRQETLIEEQKEKDRFAKEQEAQMQAEAERNFLLEALKQKQEFERSLKRDANEQATPYTYKIGRHANETLAIRYGIANLSHDQKSACDTINLRKKGRFSHSAPHYLVELTDFRNRTAIAVIEPGTEYVKTFLPMDADWFRRFERLELTLKGNTTMTLKELANFHVHAIIADEKRGQ